MNTLQGRTLLITGATRGIGLAIALRAARDGARIVVAGKTETPHPKLPGTIHTAAEAIRAAGGEALPLVVDVRDEDQVRRALDATRDRFGGLDAVVNNASAIRLSDSAATEMKHFDLMMGVNTRGTFMVTKLALPLLERSDNPHVLMLSPPLDLAEKWFAPHPAYSIAKYGMSLCVLGFAGEFRDRGIAVNALWPRTTIATAAIEFVVGEGLMRHSRKPEIVADAAHAVLTRPARDFTGNFLIDDTFLASQGVTDFDRYRVDPTVPLAPDFFVPDDSVPPASLGPAGS